MMVNMQMIRNAISIVELKTKTLPKSEIDRLNKLLELTPREFVSFQQLKSIAQATGKIDLETALFVYNALGNWSKTDIATKYVLTELHARFLGSK